MEDYLGKHPAFHEGPDIKASDMLWAEFQACLKLGIDPDVMFAKPRESRKLIVGGAVADSAIKAMRDYEAAKEREAEAKRNRGK